MATIKDVAKHANVGISTVSRMMNQTGYVSADSRKRIEKAIQELNYIPNERARNLSRKRSGIIGIIIPDFQIPFYAAFIHHVEMNLYPLGYKTMICNTIEVSHREREYLDMLDRNIVDGIITGALSVEDTVYQQIDKPIVSMDHNLGSRIPLIHSDHKKGGRLLAEHLISRGCRNILQIGTGFSANTPSNDRYEEFRQTLTAHGIPMDTLEAEWNPMDYSRYASFLLAHLDKIRSFDGVFTSDMGAAALCRFASEHNISVPDQLKIAGYDGTELTRMFCPVITTICQDIPLLATKCVDTLLCLIQKKEVPEYHQITDVWLQQGGST